MEDPQAPGVVDDRSTRPSHGLLFWQLGQIAGSRFRRALQPLGLQTQPFVVLKALAVLGPASQAELSEAVGIDPSNLVSVVAALEAGGLLERRRDAANRRRYVVTVTPAGLDLLGRAQDAIATAEDAMLGSLSAAERDALHRTLVRVLAHLPETGPAPGR
jgi:DNA-binding MarR family transcriptional regulator